MNKPINSMDTSLYFSSVSNASSEIAKETGKKRKSENSSKISFADVLKKNRASNEMTAAGFSSEVAEMQPEEAVIYLKDKMDEAGDRLSVEFTAEAFANYRQTVQQFVKYIIKNNFTIEKTERRGINTKTGKPHDPRLQVKIIDEKLDRLAADMLMSHMNKLQMMARVNEIQGLVVDLLAA